MLFVLGVPCPPVSLAKASRRLAKASRSLLESCIDLALFSGSLVAFGLLPEFHVLH